MDAWVIVPDVILGGKPDWGRLIWVLTRRFVVSCHHGVMLNPLSDFPWL